MKTDTKMVLFFLSFLAVARCTNLQPLTSSDEENRVEPIEGSTAGDRGGDLHPETSASESTTAAATVAIDGHRSGKQFYQPSAFAYQPYPQRRAYNKSPGQSMKRPKFRTKPGGGRRGLRPRRRPAMSGQPPMSSMTGSRYRRLPAPAPIMRPQHVNYIDTAGGVDYDDGFESAPLPVSSFDYGDMRELDHESAAYAYAPPMQAVGGGRSRKRPVVVAAAPAVGYADETRPAAIMHVPVRVIRPSAPTPPTTTDEGNAVADPMDKLRQLVHEAMDEHFANRHQELYGDGFGKQQQQQQHQPNMQQMHQVYSAKYKRQPPAPADKEKALHHGHQQQRTADAVRSTTGSVPASSQLSSVKVTKDADVDADGSDDRLTLAEISAYMGAKPAETVLSAGGHRYVLSDALQQSYRQQQQRQQPEHHHQQYGGEDHHQPQYLRYVSPFEALYELPAARWTYK